MTPASVMTGSDVVNVVLMLFLGLALFVMGLVSGLAIMSFWELSNKEQESKLNLDNKSCDTCGSNKGSDE